MWCKTIWKIKKLTTGPSNDYTSGCLLDYEYMKNHCRLIAVELSRQKELDAHLKAIWQVEFIGQLKNDDGKILVVPIYVYLNSFRKNQINETNIFTRKCNSLIKDGRLRRNKS